MSPNNLTCRYHDVNTNTKNINLFSYENELKLVKDTYDNYKKNIIFETYNINFGSYFIHNTKIAFSTLDGIHFMYISSSYHHTNFGLQNGSKDEYYKNPEDNDIVKTDDRDVFVIYKSIKFKVILKAIILDLKLLMVITN